MAKRYRGKLSKIQEEDGFSMIELIVTVSIIVILVAIVTIQVPGMITRYNVERQIKEMYSDFMTAREKAMTRNRIHFVTFPAARQYSIYEDTNPSPDGDGTLQVNNDARILQKTTRYDIVATLADNSAPLKTTFNQNGIITNLGNIRLSSTVKADYDCILLAPTRISLGKYDGTNCNAK